MYCFAEDRGSEKKNMFAAQRCRQTEKTEISQKKIIAGIKQSNNQKNTLTK